MRIGTHRSTTRGQALVLAVLSMLILTLTFLLSFNISHALHEKIQLQQHSDALAYSMGVVEARAFNYFATSNRTIAASFVAMNSLHAYMAAASVEPAMMKAAANNFLIIALEEFCYCLCGCPWDCQFQHCGHAMKALKVRQKFNKASKKYAKKVKKLDKAFEKAVNDIDTMVKRIHLSQTLVEAETTQTLLNGTGSGLSKLKQNAPTATSIPAAVGAMNDMEFFCALDTKNGCSKPSTTSVAIHAHIMTEVANATRPDWPANRGFSSIPIYLNPTFLDDLMHKIQGNGITLPLDHKGTAKTANSEGSIHSGRSNGNTGKVSGADEHGMLLSQFHDGVSVWKYKATVYSDSNNGGHTPSTAHQGQHKFNGVYAKSLSACLGSSNCFMKFRSDPDAKNDFGQPSVYSYTSENLRVGNPSKAPWELNSSGSLSVKGFGSGTSTLQLTAKQGAAISKALVYFHRLSSDGSPWNAEPNLFDPYWRVKLHPFQPKEAAKVLGAAGDSDAAQLAAGATDLPM